MTDKKKIKTYAETEKMGRKDEDQADEDEKKISSRSGETDEDDPVALKSRINELKQEAQGNYDRFLRVSAEFENFKKRTTREMAEHKKFALETVMKELLSVVDNLERAVDCSENDECNNQSLVQGVEMTLKGILTVLEKFGVTPVESIEQPFDPNYHQAMMRQESDDFPENTVLKELQKGYVMHDRLIRPSLVVVSASKPENEAGNDFE